MGFEYVLLDFDGTIADSADGVINSIEYALNVLGKVFPQKIDKSVVIGPPLEYTFEEYMGFSCEETEKFISEYRVYYDKHGMYQCKIYDGIPKLVRNLHKKGKKVMIASSKHQSAIEGILKYYGLENEFDFVAGCSTDFSRTTKLAVMQYILNITEIDASKTVMVGDKHYDVEASKALGIKCIGVTYGFGTRDELESSGADFIADTVAEIEKFT